MKIYASPFILKLNDAQFLQGPAVRTAASSLIIRKSLGNHTQHLLQVFFTSLFDLFGREKIFNCIMLSLSFSSAINGPRDMFVIKD